MQVQFMMATLFAGAVFSMSGFAGELAEDDKKRRGAVSAVAPSFEPVVDIHNSAVVLQHPTENAPNAVSLAKLKSLREQGEQRESHRKAEYMARGKAYPERFPGD